MDIKELFQKYNLVTEVENKSVEDMFESRTYREDIKTDPDYQRNYVWDKNKQTYLIDSMLLGVSIPPLIFFEFNDEMEIIDGRQRFETIDRFLNNNFLLQTKMLSMPLSDLKLKSFSKLDKQYQQKLRRYTLSIVRLKVSQSKPIEEELYKIKIEIFKRYNIGITPIRKIDIFRAKHINNEYLNFFTKEIKKENIFEIFCSLFSPIRKFETDEEVRKKIIYLLVLNKLNIIKYANQPNKEDYFSEYFKQSDEFVDNNIENIKDDFIKFKRVIKVLKHILYSFENLDKSRLIFEVLLRKLYFLEDALMRNIETKDFDKARVLRLKNVINNEKRLFYTDNYHYPNNIINRYKMIREFFEKEFDIKLDDNILEQEDIENDNENDELIEEKITIDNNFSIKTSSSESLSIDSIIQRIKRNEFHVRPLYQRGEVIGKVGASKIIESILLNIKLPTIFLYENSDGIQEVIDGQQRLTSILGFIGEKIADINGELAETTKHNFKLNGLEILSELNGKNYNDLEKQNRKKILNFTTTVINIKANENPNFNPEEMFIRLNNKPYPIKQDSFELWNSYINNLFILKVKEKIKDKKDWFFVKKITPTVSDRMENEELLTTITFFEYLLDSKKNIDIQSLFTISIRNEKISIKMKPSKKAITVFLQDSSEDILIKYFKKACSFISKIESLLINQNIEHPMDKNDVFKKRLTELFNKNTDKNRRTFQDFYILWLILSKISLTQIIAKREILYFDIQNFYLDIKENKYTYSKENVINKIEHLFERYGIDERNLKLSKEEQSKMILEQKSICPICNQALFIGDNIEIDHINPISLGGEDNINNLQIVHKLCNREKSNKI